MYHFGKLQENLPFHAFILHYCWLFDLPLWQKVSIKKDIFKVLLLPQYYHTNNMGVALPFTS